MRNKVIFNDLSALAICYVLFFSRLLLPYMIYVFLLFSISFTFYKLWKNRFRFRQFNSISLFKYVKSYYILLLLCLFFIIGVVNSKVISFYLLKEILALVMIINLSLLTYYIVDDNDKFNQFLQKIKKSLYFVLIIVCVLSPIKYYFELRGVYFDFLRTDSTNWYPIGSSLILDYNFFSLMNISGMIFLFFDLSKTKKRSLYYFLIQFFIFCLSFNVILSSSRRASILLVAIYLIWLLIPIYNLFSIKFTKLIKYRLKFPVFLYIVVIGIYFVFSFLFTKENNLKYAFFNSIGIDSIEFDKSINFIFDRYGTIIHQNEVIEMTKTEPLQINTVNALNTVEDTIKLNDVTIISDSSENELVKDIPEKSKEVIKVDENLENDENILDSNNKLFGNRADRIKFAFEIFNDFTLSQKIFGNGFDYMIIFGNRYTVALGLDFGYDYPHNPIISSLLYSGILGFLYSLFFISFLFYNICRYFFGIMSLSLVFIIHFFFILFSGNSLFGTPEFLILGLIIMQYNVLNNSKSENYYKKIEVKI